MAVTVHALPRQEPREHRTAYPSYLRLGYPGLIVGAVMAVCLLSLLFLAQTGRVATRGYMLQELKDQHAVLVHEAQQHEYRIAEANRLDVIEARAMALGMRRATPQQLRFATIEMTGGPVVAQR
jgi:hypothetical protein